MRLDILRQSQGVDGEADDNRDKGSGGESERLTGNIRRQLMGNYHDYHRGNAADDGRQFRSPINGDEIRRQGKGKGDERGHKEVALDASHSSSIGNEQKRGNGKDQGEKHE